MNAYQLRFVRAGITVRSSSTALRSGSTRRGRLARQTTGPETTRRIDAPRADAVETSPLGALALKLGRASPEDYCGS